MDRVGGYMSYKLLESDARDYDDVWLALLGESDANQIMKTQHGHTA